MECMGYISHSIIRAVSEAETEHLGAIWSACGAFNPALRFDASTSSRAV